jgi:hypothetical protein
LWIPLKEGIGGEREGEDFTDESIEKRNSEIAIFRKHVGHFAVHGIPTEIHRGKILSKVLMIFSTIEAKKFHNNYKSNEKFDAHLMGHFLKMLRVVPIYLSVCENNGSCT